MGGPCARTAQLFCTPSCRRSARCIPWTRAACTCLGRHMAPCTLAIAVPASEYFAAIATDGGVLMKEVVPYLSSVSRRIPIAMWTDKKNDLFPLAQVRATRDVLNRYGFGVTLTEVAGHSGYGEVNRAAWEFLQTIASTAIPDRSDDVRWTPISSASSQSSARRSRFSMIR